MHYLTAANGGKQFIPLFTDIAILKNIYGNAARICIIDYETAMEAAKMEIIDYNGNKANIDSFFSSLSSKESIRTAFRNIERKPNVNENDAPRPKGRGIVASG